MTETNTLVVFGVTAVYITACLVYLDGPVDVFLRIRKVALTRCPATLGKLLECAWCTGFWVGLLCAVGAILTLGYSLGYTVPLGMAYAAAAGYLLEDNENG